jgi:hypothetical protein
MAKHFIKQKIFFNVAVRNLNKFYNCWWVLLKIWKYKSEAEFEYPNCE